MQPITVVSNETITAERFLGANELGEMALAIIPLGITAYHFVIGRGLTSSGSCLFKGALAKLSLLPLEILISPEIRPKTSEGQRIVGHEDPTPLQPLMNFWEVGEFGVLATEAYESSKIQGWTDANLIYMNLETRIVRTILTPEMVLAQLGHRYKRLNLVKEAEVAQFDKKNYLLFEIGADDASRIAQAHVLYDGSIGRISKFLDPISDTWYSHHVSTACSPIPLKDGSFLLIFNGRDENTWRVGWMILDQLGRIVTIGDPFLSPPLGVPAGPHGQQIAFASYFDPETNDLYYHAQDRYICVARLRINI